VREVDRDTLEPILFLLQSPDLEVQRAASAALGNLAVNGTQQMPGLFIVIQLTNYSGKQGSNCVTRRPYSPHSPNDVHKC
jgi:hypothetical protein